MARAGEGEAMLELELSVAREEAGRLRRICDAKERALEEVRGEVDGVRRRAEVQAEEIRGMRVAMLTRSMQAVVPEAPRGGGAEVEKLKRRVMELEAAAALWGGGGEEREGARRGKEEERLRLRLKELEEILEEAKKGWREEVGEAREEVHAMRAMVHGLERRLVEAEAYVEERGRELERAKGERERAGRAEEEARRRAAEADEERARAVRVLKCKEVEVEAMEKQVQMMRDEVSENKESSLRIASLPLATRVHAWTPRMIAEIFSSSTSSQVCSFPPIFTPSLCPSPPPSSLCQVSAHRGMAESIGREGERVIEAMSRQAMRCRLDLAALAKHIRCDPPLALPVILARSRAPTSDADQHCLRHFGRVAPC